MPRTRGLHPSPGNTGGGVFGRWGQGQGVRPLWVALEGDSGTWPPPPTASGHPARMFWPHRRAAESQSGGPAWPGISRPWFESSSKAETQLCPWSTVTSGILLQGWKLKSMPRSQESRQESPGGTPSRPFVKEGLPPPSRRWQTQVAGARGPRPGLQPAPATTLVSDKRRHGDRKQAAGGSGTANKWVCLGGNVLELGGGDGCTALPHQQPSAGRLAEESHGAWLALMKVPQGRGRTAVTELRGRGTGEMQVHITHMACCCSGSYSEGPWGRAPRPLHSLVPRIPESRPEEQLWLWGPALVPRM